MKRMYMIALTGLIISLNVIGANEPAASKSTFPIPEIYRGLDTPETRARLIYLDRQYKNGTIRPQDLEEYGDLKSIHRGVVKDYVIR